MIVRGFDEWDRLCDRNGNKSRANDSPQYCHETSFGRKLSSLDGEVLSRWKLFNFGYVDKL
jgi:hypothetical protein